ncbi:hypothetical protein JXA40_02185 [bacterium]|nr:hypothetical protein [candidate division CSSED10-310 bacterium]
MAVKPIIALVMIASICLPVVSAQDIEPQNPFPIYPETTQLGDFLCRLTFWRGLPPCFKGTIPHGSYVLYPTRQKARIIIDSFLIYGLYSQELLVSFFGSLSTGAYRPEPSIPVGNYWDSAYFALVQLDNRIEAKKLLMDIVFERDWARGKFPNERFKALRVLANERVITLREYKPLVESLQVEITKPVPDMNWVNAIVYALSSFREWNDELLPIFEEVMTVTPPGNYQTLLQAFIDFNIPDEGEFIIDQVIQGKVQDLEDRKLCVRAAYVLDSELAEIKLKQYLDTLKSREEQAELNRFVVNTLERLKWYGNWEIIESSESIDPGLKNEKIAFRMTKSLDPDDDVVNFSMTMQISWEPGQLKPIGLEETYETNNVSFHVTPEKLTFTITYPEEHMRIEKPFLIKEGTGREVGRTYLRFPVPGEKDRRGDPKYGWILIEKIG